MSVTERIVPTSQATIAVMETSSDGLPLILIHGNSSSKEAFRRQLESPLARTSRLVAIDLPGHGGSSNADDPERVYSMPGYADIVVEVLEALNIDKAVVFGWSLGGHVGLELIPRYAGLVGLMIAGTPPVSPTPEGIQKGFKPNPDLLLFGQNALTDEQVRACANAAYGKGINGELFDAMKRTDGRARSMMFASLYAGMCSDQKMVAENCPVPLAVLNGAEDPLINVEYVAGLSYKNLWENHCFLLRGSGHAPFLTDAAAFNQILGRFLRDMEQRAARIQPARWRTPLGALAGP